MKLAKMVGEEVNPCFSRHIGVVIMNPRSNTIVGTGYNGPPQGTPHCDSYDFLKNYFYPQLTDKEKFEKGSVEEFARAYENCATCPRRLVGAASGERTELCSCQHAERNAITNAGIVDGCYMFCWCGVPCIQCTGTIINAGISKVYCLQATDYHSESRWLFAKSSTELIEIGSETITLD